MPARSLGPVEHVLYVLGPGHQGGALLIRVEVGPADSANSQQSRILRAGESVAAKIAAPRRTRWGWQRECSKSRRNARVRHCGPPLCPSARAAVARRTAEA